MNRRRICVLTTTRADYGLLYWLMHDLRSSAETELQVAVTGMHLSTEFGLTSRAIEEDGFVIDAKVEALLSSDTPVGVAKSMGLATIGFADVFERLQPDLLVVLGDRYEVLAAAQAAMVARIPIAHIHGGEATEGLIDEAIRHALTKMAQLHFTAAEDYRTRVIQLGENPERVFNVGATGLDNIRRLPLLDRGALEDRLETSLRAPLLLATYHPVTLSGEDPSHPMEQMLSALDGFPEGTVVLTKGNADTHGRIINEMIDRFVEERPGRTIGVASLGQLTYLSLLQAADCVVGNSSSGIIEAPAVGTPTVNIGDRQRGRLRSPSVIDCPESASSIRAAISDALSPQSRATASRRETPFGEGRAAERIVEVLSSIPLEGILMKRFHDLDFVP